MEKYNIIGKSYNSTRQADPRITKGIINKLRLPTGAIIADIGAGTGNYSIELVKHGLKVIAVEPSEVMRKQGKQHSNLQWIAGIAENIPLGDSSVDGIVCTLAIHHFENVKQSLREMIRVVKDNGPVIILAADLRLCPKNFWLADYFEPIFKQTNDVPMQELSNTLTNIACNDVEIIKFMLPHDLIDQFFFSGWRKPGFYLNPIFCEGISSLASAPKDILDACLTRLANDLKDGTWKKKYGGILNYNEYDGGYRFLITHKKQK